MYRLRWTLSILILLIKPDAKAQEQSDMPRARVLNELGPVQASDYVYVRSVDSPYVDSVYLLLWDRKTLLAKKMLVDNFAQFDVRHFPAGSYYMLLFYRNRDTSYLDFRIKPKS